VTEDSDTDLFRQAMRDVRRMDGRNRVEPVPRRPAPIPHQRLADERKVLHELLAPEQEVHDLGAERGEALSYLRDGYPRRLLRRLRRGHFALGGELDLHGMVTDEARMALAEFLAEAHQRHWSSVRIIHGKGRRSSNRGPVLKGKVDRWLRQRDDIIAFCSARPVDGGTGAVYVLLRQ
jgi:DNA-nicking Smr family endonuclease